MTSAFVIAWYRGTDPSDRRHIHDSAVASLPHAIHDGACGVDHPECIDPLHAIKDCRIVGVQRSRRDNPSIIDQDADRSEVFVHPGRHGRHLRFIGNVGLNGIALPPAAVISCTRASAASFRAT
jgi:hypothetical protein